MRFDYYAARVEELVRPRHLRRAARRFGFLRHLLGDVGLILLGAFGVDAPSPREALIFDLPRCAGSRLVRP